MLYSYHVVGSRSTGVVGCSGDERRSRSARSKIKFEAEKVVFVWVKSAAFLFSRKPTPRF